MITIDAHIDGSDRSASAAVRSYNADGIPDFATLDVIVPGAEIRFYSHKGNVSALQRIADIFNAEFAPAKTEQVSSGDELPF